MRSFLLKLIFYFLLVFLIINSIAAFSLFQLSQSQLYKPQFIKNGVSEKEFDYMILGSSTGLTTLNTKLIDSIFKWNGLNASMDDTSLSSHSLMLEYFYSLGKRTKRVVLCVTPWDLSSGQRKINNNDYRFISEIYNPKIYSYFYELDKSTLGVLRNTKFIPFLGVSYYNNEVFYPSIFTFFNRTKRNRFDERGNYTYPTNNKTILKKDKSILNVKINNPSYFKIVEFCKRNDIELIVYQSPIYNTEIKLSNTFFINHSSILDESLFYDNIHVNSIGRTFCTLAFCNDLKKKI